MEVNGQMTDLQEIKNSINQDPDELILDTGSLITLLMNKELGLNIRRAKHPIVVATNTGAKKTELQMSMPGMEDEV